METPKIYLVYPWETPPLFAKLLASTYVGESHFVWAWWDYQEVVVVTLLVATGLGEITQMAVAAIALSSNGLVWRPRWLVAATKWLW
jgi:hypothetical protein